MLSPLWWQIPVTFYQITRCLIAGGPSLHTGVYIASINEDKRQCNSGLHSKSFRHFKWLLSERVLQILWPSYISHVISSYYASRRILVSPCVYKNILIHTHMNSHTPLISRIVIDWLILPLAVVRSLVELILLKQTWRYVF